MISFDLGIPQEELLRQQEAMFAQAKFKQAQEEWMQMQQQGGIPQIAQTVDGNTLANTTDVSAPQGGQSSISNNSPAAAQNSITTSVIQEPRRSNVDDKSLDNT